jgi:GNAT superfamily N-acetyltransferase
MTDRTDTGVAGIRIGLADSSDVDVIHQIAGYLKAEIELMRPGLKHQNVVLVARDADDALVGGLVGVINWSWFLIHVVWVARGHRGKGIGSALMEAAEQEARRHGCDRAHLSTHDFQAPAFYGRLGYSIFSVWDDYPVGSKMFHMKKALP